MTEPTLLWDDVRITYAGGNVAVDGVSLEVERGGTVGLAGESGCGKSTLAMSVLRLLPRSARIEGRIVLQGEDVAGMTWGRLRAVRWTEAAIVFQGAMHSLNPVRQVRHQVAEALALHSTKEFPDSAARLRRVDELLALVDLSPAKGRAYPHELSGGQRQRVMIAMALACDPELIIADEPTTALDVVVQAQVLDVLNGLVRDRELTLVMISHDLAVLAAVCDRIVVMQHGRIVEQGKAQQILTAPTHEHTQELAAAFPIIGDPSSRLVVGRNASPGSPGEAGVSTGSTAEAGRAVLEVRDLTVDFRSRGQHVRAVDHVDLTCGAGEIVALVGQSGSGKTTLARTILGLQKPTSGQVLHEGKPLPHRRGALKAYRRQVQYVLQDPAASLNPKHTVYEAVAEGIRIHGLDDERERVIRALTRAELTPPEKFFAAIPQELSGGQRQRVVIAGALALDPTYLVADEPVASLDASVRGEILALLLQLRRDLGLGALVITHDLGLAWNIADRVVVMHRGRIVENGAVEQVLLDPQHDYTKSLLAVVPSKLGLR
ncbi:peptide ABC transporter ATP-binding protein [Aeromicrobium sp. Root344]|uniref:ABC transporter ATP-binding protein n=1 Tax=Aeromicrobium sp. Root344 TaxID=1736521 RepID=UPI0006F63199|nr:ABC transporter ATP-binding protein [Aeromicrobium sp. Root344]KQV74622.1 peptide ABC transporter ATP-binding protein [Aeromicrobium sp. Root344]